MRHNGVMNADNVVLMGENVPDATVSPRQVRPFFYATRRIIDEYNKNMLRISGMESMGKELALIELDMAEKIIKKQIERESNEAKK